MAFVICSSIVYWMILICCLSLWFSRVNALFSVFNCFIFSIKSLVCFDILYLQYRIWYLNLFLFINV